MCPKFISKCLFKYHDHSGPVFYEKPAFLIRYTKQFSGS